MVREEEKASVSGESFWRRLFLCEWVFIFLHMCASSSSMMEALAYCVSWNVVLFSFPGLEVSRHSLLNCACCLLGVFLLRKTR